MKAIKINVHSFVDVITNSSTVIYVGVHGKTIELMKEFINYFLKNSGSKKTADQVFEFRIDPDPDWKNDTISDIMNEEGCLRNKAAEIFEEKFKNGEIEGSGSCDRRILMLIPWDDSSDTMDVTAMVQEIFSIEEDNWD